MGFLSAKNRGNETFVIATLEKIVSCLDNALVNK